MELHGSNLKFQIEKDVFLLGLQRIQGIIEKKSTTPAFSNVLIEGHEGTSKIIMTATDLEIGIRVIYKANIQNSGGVVVPGRKLFEIIRELPSGPVSVEVEDRKCVTIRSGKSCFKITGFSKEDFPSLPDIIEERMFSAGAGVFKEMIRKVSFAIPDAEARQVLTGALLEIEEEDNLIKLKMIGTDGHRLAVCGRTLKSGTGTLEKIEEGQQIIIPKKTLLEIRRFLDTDEEIKIGIGEKLVYFKGGDVYLTSRLIEGPYPNYKQVIPQKGDNVVKAVRSDFISAVKRVSVMSREKTKAILIEFTPGKAVLRARDQEVGGEATEEVDLSYKGSEITVGLNYQYLLEALESIEDEDVIIEMQSNLSPCTIKQESDPDSLCIVMPMRIQETE